MNKILSCIFLTILLCISVSARAKYSDYAQRGGKSVRTGSVTTYNLMETFPNCVITVYITGTLTPASIYSDNIGTAKANPFTADSSSYFEFWADNGIYDVKFSGTGILTPFTKSGISIIDPLDPSYNVKSFGAKCDGSTNDKSAVQAAVNSIPSTGGTLLFPVGTCNFGAASQGILIRITNKSNVKIKGQGIGTTTLIYDSSFRTVATGSGSLFYVGDYFINHTADGFEISDLTISDINSTNPSIYGGAGAAGLFVFLCDNVRIERIQTINVKGNAGITVMGTNPSNKNLTITDCNILGTSLGGWNDGDGINAGNYNNSHIDRNIITGTLRHGIEGAGVNSNGLFYVGNNIDMQDQGLEGIGTLEGTNITVSGNIIININAGGKGIGLSQDLITIPIKNINITDNTIIGATVGSPSQLGINFQPIPGASSSILGPIIISNNVIKMYSPIALWTGTSVKIVNNQINLNGANSAAINGNNGSNPAIPAGDMVEIYNNRVFGNTAGVTKITQAWDSNWTNARFKAFGNSLATDNYVYGFTINSGVVDLTTSNQLSYQQFRMVIDTEGGAATDDLVTITPCINNDTLIIQSANDSRDVTLKNGTGNLRIGTDFTLLTTRDRILLQCDGTNWFQLSRNTN